MRTQVTFLVSSIFKPKKYIRMQATARNETIWIVQSWEFNSSATAVPAAVALPFAFKSAALCRIVLELFKFLARAECRITGKMDLFLIICNGAVWRSISIFRSRAVQCMSALRLLLLTVASRSLWWFRVCQADSTEGLTVSLSDLVGRLVLSLTA